jgi:hypothetical protein
MRALANTFMLCRRCEALKLQKIMAGSPLPAKFQSRPTTNRMAPCDAQGVPDKNQAATMKTLRDRFSIQTARFHLFPSRRPVRLLCFNEVLRLRQPGY